MNEKEIFNIVADMLSESFNVKREDITENLNFQNDLNADSIDFVEFVMNLENKFNKDISDEDAEKLTTVGEVVAYIKEHQD